LPTISGCPPLTGGMDIHKMLHRNLSLYASAEIQKDTEM
jgi:hypothetical protein